MLVGTLGFSPDVDRFREMQGAGFGGDSERKAYPFGYYNPNCWGLFAWRTAENTQGIAA
jgi:hypothetical protein